MFESARLVPENRTVSVFASHHNSSQENLKFSSSLTTQKTKMKKLLVSMPSIRNTSHVRGMVCFISLFSNQFLSLGFFCNEKGRLETGIILQFPVFDSLRYRPFVQCSAEILADGVLAG